MKELDRLSNDQLEKIKLIMDIISQKAKADNIENSVDLLMDHIPPFTYEVIIPYSHFPSSIEPFEINQLIQKIADDFGVINSVKFKSDNSVSLRFPLYNNNDFKNLKKIIDDRYLELEGKEENKFANGYEISVKDREILVNNKYIIARPHSTGNNFEFMEFLLNNQDKDIERSELPEYLRGEIRGKRFYKIIGGLGFSGEILKAFFPKRGKGQLVFRKTVSKEDLKKSGINENIFLKELELANVKHSPK